MVRTHITEPIAEGTTPLLTATAVDGDGTPVVALQTATLTLYDKDTQVIINDRNSDNILTSFAAGVFTVRLEVADTPILNTALLKEQHIALIEWTWDLGLGASGSGKHEIEHTIHNAAHVPGSP